MKHAKEMTFYWNISAECNYRCPYCWNHANWHRGAKENTYLSVKEWAGRWENIYNKYGPVKLCIGGGEPFLYPGFAGLVDELSGKHKLRIVSNLSFDVESFLGQVRAEPEDLRIIGIFHPIFSEFREFLKKAVVLKEKGLLNGILYADYAPQAKLIGHYKEGFEKEGLSFKTISLDSGDRARFYPVVYADKEKSCRPDKASVFIDYKGAVTMRSFDSDDVIGSFLDKDFSLPENLSPCGSQDRGYPKGRDIKTALVLAPGWGRVSPPYALALLAAILKQKNHPVRPFDINNTLYHSSREKDRLLWNWEESSFWQREEDVERYLSENDKVIDDTVAQIVGYGADLVGFSVYSTTRLMSIELAKKIKRAKPEVYILFGGAECRKDLDWRSLMQQDCVDFLAFDEVDETLPELVDLLSKDGDLSGCRGLVYKKAGKIVECGERPVLKDLDALPFADFSGFDIFSYKGQCPTVLKIATSRGCPERCLYCSTKAAVKRYRTMSGKRVFEEIKHHVKNYKERAGKDNALYLFFLDLLLNANVKVMEEWVSALADAREKDEDFKDLNWYGQVILRRGMTKELFQKIKRSGCDMLNYGVESGSTKILNDMKKRLSSDEMGDIIKLMHEAGIPTRGNFMFGFPTETEEDFEETIDFLKKNGGYMKEVYPSRTFCALERFSYLYDHRDEFGIFMPPNKEQHLFWESQGGKNNYLVRLKRYERFCEVAASFPHNPLRTGVQDIKRDNCLCLGEYYRSIGSYKKALDYYNKYLSEGGADKSVYESIYLCERELYGEAERKSFNDGENAGDQKKNFLLNQKEYKENKIILESTPPNVYFQIDGPCNQDCIFCSRPEDYDHFSLKEYMTGLEKILYPIFRNAATIYLTGAGEFLMLPEAEKILGYFNKEFPFAGKMFAANGSMIGPNIAHLIAESKSKYSIRISLHASNAALHKKLTLSDNFEKIVRNIGYLCKLRDKYGNPEVCLTFLVTTANVEDLPDFVRLASRLKADTVYCEYNSIYKPEQKYLSCYFKQDLTNSIFDKAEEIAKDIGVDLKLPWRFNQKSYPEIKCDQPWTQIMINRKGEALPCCLFGDFHESLLEKDFWHIWNGDIYQRIRRFLMRDKGFCRYCLRNKPGTVNDFRSHIITRGKSEKDLEHEFLNI